MVGFVDRSRGAQDIVGGHAARYPRTLVAAARAADAFEDSFADQALQHGLQVSRRQVMARRERFCRDWTSWSLHRHIDDGCNCEESFAWEQRHVWEKRRWRGIGREAVTCYIRNEFLAKSGNLAAGLSSLRFQSG